MSEKKPVLVLQMQRMGDLVLSFPLLGWLAAFFPEHPIWVVGEPTFFKPLMPLSPQVTYFGYESADRLTKRPYHLVLNLSHRPEAAALAGRVSCDALLGPVLEPGGALRIRGNWQLYRASLTNNNYYNLFHWADLNALDLIPSLQMRRTAWPLPRKARTAQTAGDQNGPVRGSGRVGLFLGASEADKHPDAEFWAAFARILIRAGRRPVLLGGAAEKRLGHAVAAKLKAHPLNLCGHFSVSTLARFIGELDLLVSPDTGPMHIAVWTGTPVLNLSLGPVNPWETGPFSPGHHVIRARMECVGCWRCVKPSVECKERMVAGRAGAVAEALLQSGPGGLGGLERKTGGLEVLRSARDGQGLYSLARVLPAPGDGAVAPGSLEEKEAERLALSRFWKAWFLYRFGRAGKEGVQGRWADMADRHPGLAGGFRAALAALALELARAVRGDAASALAEDTFWQAASLHLRPLSGFMQMDVQNRSADKASLRDAVSMVEELFALGEG